MADSSLVVEGLLAGAEEFESERFLAPDLVVPEVVNALYVQHRVLHSIPDGLPYLVRLFRAIESGSLVLVPVSKELAASAYEIAAGSGAAVYDSLFVALALRTGMQLGTRDQRQGKILEAERRRLPRRGRETSRGGGRG